MRIINAVATTKVSAETKLGRERSICSAGVVCADLSDDRVDELIEAGRQLIRRNGEFQRLIKEANKSRH